MSCAAGFDGARVLSSRRGGVPYVAASMKEVPFTQHDDVYAWAERLFAGGDVVRRRARLWAAECAGVAAS